ncbi:hypothetical protein MKX08_007818 [Trichoderma sp. CBMAI-0020]|nr:hypothetical protein MKX08_007818 [Trichoderma sp. CBMAI-0020]
MRVMANGALIAQCNMTPQELASFLEYGATFLCNLGDFYVAKSAVCRLKLSGSLPHFPKDEGRGEYPRSKVLKDGKPVLQLLQASAETDVLENDGDELADGILLVRGIRSEWEAVIGVADDEVEKLRTFVEASTTFIRQLPWAVDGVNDGKGQYEKSI